MRSSKISFIDFYSHYVGLLLFVQLLFPKLLAPALALFVPLLVLGLSKKKLQFRFQWMGALFVFLYVVYLIYCSFTRNPEWAQRYLEYKLSFLLFPFIFSFVPTEKVRTKIIAIWFIVSACLMALVGLIHSVYLYRTTDLGFVSFLSSYYSTIHHPTYASVYLTVALFILWYSKLRKQHWEPKGWLTVLISIILILGTLFCLSLAGLLILFGLIIGFIVYSIALKWGRPAMFAFLFGIPFVLIVFVRVEPHLQWEFENAYTSAKEYFHSPDEFIRKRIYPDISGSEVRLILWTASTEIVKEYPWGVGTGNVDEVMSHQLKQYNQHAMAERNFNPHNQYFQTLIEIGIGGFLLLLSILIVGIRLGWKYRSGVFLFVIGSLGFNMLFESMLQQQSGVVFYTLVCCFLSMLVAKKKQETTSN